MAIKQEFDAYGNHRLVNDETGAVTRWAPHTGFTYLDGMVGTTDYYTGDGGPMVLTPTEFVEIAASGEA